MRDFGWQRSAENRRRGSTQNKLVGDARKLGMSVRPGRTSADRIAAKSRSASLQPLRRPASMGLTKSWRKEASEENTPGLTNSDSAKSSCWLGGRSTPTSKSFWMGVPERSTRRREGNWRRLSMVALPVELLRRWPSSQTRSPALLPLMASAYLRYILNEGEKSNRTS